MNCTKCGLPILGGQLDLNTTAVQHAKCPTKVQTMSDTPRTDEALRQTDENVCYRGFVTDDFARQLEREVNQLYEKVAFTNQVCDAWQAQFEAEQKAHRETKLDRMKLCDRISVLETALRDAISTYGPKPEILVTEERVEAWKHALNAKV